MCHVLVCCVVCERAGKLQERAQECKQASTKAVPVIRKAVLVHMNTSTDAQRCNVIYIYKQKGGLRSHSFTRTQEAI